TADGELELHVAVTVRGDEVELDFAGTAPQHEGNLNCPLAVTRSACYFVVRCLTDPDVPASAGAFAPVTVLAPPGSLVNALPPPAGGAGAGPRPRGRGSRPGRSSRPRGSSTSSSPPSAGRSPCPPRARGR